MIFNPYIYKLYYPNGDSEYSGGGAEGGRGEGESPSGEPTGGGTMYSTTTTNGGGEVENNGRREDDYLQPEFWLKRKDPNNTSKTKEINVFTIESIKGNAGFIDPKGERKRINIFGTAGAIFSLTVKDSSGCNILREKVENVSIPESGRYIIVQDFPSIISDGSFTKTKETYSIEITPAADVYLNSVTKMLIEQIADPVITVTKTTSQTSPALSIASVDDLEITGPARSKNNRAASVYTLTVTENPEDSAGKLYVKSTNFNDNISSNTLIKKLVNRGGDDVKGSTNTYTLDHLTTRTTSTIENSDGARIRNADGSFTENTNTTHELINGMTAYAKVVYDREFVANLDENNNVLDGNCQTIPTRIKINNTNDLFAGMHVYGDVESGTILASVDCDKTITIIPGQIIKNNTTLRFEKRYYNSVSEVLTNNNSRQQAEIRLMANEDIPNGTEVEFDNDKNQITGVVRFDTSGADQIVLKAHVKPIKFGDANVTYTLNLDNLITSKPNAYNKSVSTKKNTAVTINMIENDYDANRASKTGTVVKKPTNGLVGDYVTSTDSFTYTPNPGFTGEDIFTFTMSDGTNSSDEKKVTIKVI
tara:strand:- start:1850 stop:3625 length:1776 start_codon:yes stop_codon:yes gene_type:complete